MPRLTKHLASLACLAAPTFVAAAPIKHVFVIAMENHNWNQPASQASPGKIYGNPAAPYINSLVTPGHPNAVQVSYCSNYQATGVGIHPSLPNYIWSEAGTNFNVFNDNDPYANGGANSQNTLNHLCGYLQRAGISWKSYQEDTDLAKNGTSLTSTPQDPNFYTVPLTSFSGSSVYYTNEYNGTHQYNFACKHNPPLYFADTNGGNNSTTSNPQASHYAPIQALSSDLESNTVPAYCWITPDQFNDMHTALSGGFTYNGTHYTADQATIAQGDNFLSIVVPQIMASRAYQDGGAIVIWNDETEGGDDPSRTIMEIVISPMAKGDAYQSTLRYTHSSDLRTWQKVFWVGPHGYVADSANAMDLSDLFLPGTIPGPITTSAPIIWDPLRSR